MAKTKREYFEEIKVMAQAQGNADIMAFCDKQIEQLANRSESKAEKEKHELNDFLCDEIKNVLGQASAPMTISEIQSHSELLAGQKNQKINAMLIKLGDKGTNEVVRIYEKKVAKFALA